MSFASRSGAWCKHFHSAETSIQCISYLAWWVCAASLSSALLLSIEDLSSAMCADLLPRRFPKSSSSVVGKIYLSAQHFKVRAIWTDCGKVCYLTARPGGLQTNLTPALLTLGLCQLTKPLRSLFTHPPRLSDRIRIQVAVASPRAV